MTFFDRFKKKKKKEVVTEETPSFNPAKIDIRNGEYSLDNVVLLPFDRVSIARSNGVLSSVDFARWVSNEVENTTYEEAVITYYNFLVDKFREAQLFGCQEEIIMLDLELQELTEELKEIGII